MHTLIWNAQKSVILCQPSRGCLRTLNSERNPTLALYRHCTLAPIQCCCSQACLWQQVRCWTSTSISTSAWAPLHPSCTGQALAALNWCRTLPRAFQRCARDVMRRHSGRRWLQHQNLSSNPGWGGPNLGRCCTPSPVPANQQAQIQASPKGFRVQSYPEPG